MMNTRLMDHLKERKFKRDQHKWYAKNLRRHFNSSFFLEEFVEQLQKNEFTVYQHKGELWMVIDGQEVPLKKLGISKKEIEFLQIRSRYRKRQKQAMEQKQGPESTLLPRLQRTPYMKP